MKTNVRFINSFEIFIHIFFNTKQISIKFSAHMYKSLQIFVITKLKSLL